MHFSRELKNAIIQLRGNYIAVLSAFMIVLTIIVVYREDLTIVVNEALYSEAVSHVILVPFIISYLLYRKREMIKVSTALKKAQEATRVLALENLVGVAICLSALLLYWYGSYTFYALEYHLISLPIFVLGITLILFNTKMLKVLMFPILFLLFLIPPPAEIIYTAGTFLAYFNTQASYTLLRAFGLPVTLSFSYASPFIELNSASGSIPYNIDVACSGVYSLIAFVMFATFLVYLVRGSVWKKASLFVLGFLILQILNIVRISSIVFIGYSLGREIAMTFFHVFSGWVLIFGGMLLLLMIGEKLLHIQIFKASETEYCPKCKSNLINYQSFCSNCGRFLRKTSTIASRRFLIKSTVLLLGFSLVTFGIQAPVFAFAQGSAVTNENWQTSTNILPEVSGYQLRFLHRDTYYEKIARQDAALFYAYLPENSSKFTIFVNLGVASSKSNLHSWETCFVSWRLSHGKPALVQVLDSRDVQIMQNPTIIARYFVFENPNNYTQVTLYWYTRAPFNTGITVEPKYVRISLIILSALNSNNYQKHEETLMPFAQSIATHWEPLKSQSLVSLGVPMLQSMLVLVITFIIFTGATKYTIEQRRKNNNLKIFEKHASQKEKIVLQTIKSTNKGTTFQTIIAALKKTAIKAIRPSELTEILNRLEDYGIVKKAAINVKDQPTLVWKA